MEDDARSSHVFSRHLPARVCYPPHSTRVAESPYGCYNGYDIPNLPVKQPFLQPVNNRFSASYATSQNLSPWNLAHSGRPLHNVATAYFEGGTSPQSNSPSLQMQKFNSEETTFDVPSAHSNYVLTSTQKPIPMLPLLIIGNLEMIQCQSAQPTITPGPIYLFILGKQLKHSSKSAKTKDEFRLFQDPDKCFVLTGSEIEPFVTLDGVILQGNVETLRYLSKRLGEYGGDRNLDYIADYAANLLQDWWGDLIDANTCLLTDEKQELFVKDGHGIANYVKKREEWFVKFEAFLKHVHETLFLGKNHVFFTGENATFCDYMLLTILLEDKLLARVASFDFNFISDTTYVKALYNALEAHPNIQAFITKYFGSEQLSQRDLGSTIESETAVVLAASEEKKNGKL